MSDFPEPSPGPTPSLSLAGLHASAIDGPWARGARAGIGWAGGLGFRQIQLDATAADTRARTLDRSARRDLAASVRRAGMGFTGLDLWIPAEHFRPGEHADRAHAALLGALDLAADLGNLARSGGSEGRSTHRPVISVNLPDGYAGAEEIAARADLLAVLIEDFGGTAERRVGRSHAESETAGSDTSGSDMSRSETAGRVRTDPGSLAAGIRPGVDTARLILRGRPPGKSFASMSNDIATLRLNDADDTGRRVMGTGRLEIGTLIALHATLTPGVPIVTDLRGLENPDRGARSAITAITAITALDGYVGGY